MCVHSKKCNAWISLHSVGIPEEGCLKNSKWFNSLPIPSNHSIFNQNIYVDLPHIKITAQKTVSHGKFGAIDFGTYETETKKTDVYIKRPIKPGKSLLYEACLMKLVSDSLTIIGFPTGAPKLLHIFKLRDNSICFAMEPIQHACTLYEYLKNTSKEHIQYVVIDCLFQVCAIVCHLERRLGINHRDLKPSNFLIVEHEPIVKHLIVCNESCDIKSRYSITLIDFGFSCMGSTETNIADISLSTVYSKDDPCPKEGRDLYLFIAFLYLEFYEKLPERFMKQMEEWLEVPGSNIIPFLQKDRQNSKKWIYFLTGNHKITKFNCCPWKILRDLKEFVR